MNQTIRPAREDDAGFLAWAILAATRSHCDRGWFDIALNRPEADCLEFLRRLAVTSAQSLWHYSRFFVAEVDGFSVAALAAFRAGDAFALAQEALTEAARRLGWSKSEQEAIWRRGSYIFKCTLETPDDAWVIENIATLSAYRKRGLAARLIERALDEGAGSGAREALITFFIGNDSAERAYQEAGFKLKDEKRHPDFEAATGVAGLRRYARRL
jgi:GNAT superfamily N-acetyltransferase